jgi:hypothetical protein
VTDSSFRDLFEQEARIRQLLADELLKETEARKRWQDFQHAPIALAATCFGAGAALVTALVALLKWIG